MWLFSQPFCSVFASCRFLSTIFFIIHSVFCVRNTKQKRTGIQNETNGLIHIFVDDDDDVETERRRSDETECVTRAFNCTLIKVLFRLFLSRSPNREMHFIQSLGCCSIRKWCSFFFVHCFGLWIWCGTWVVMMCKLNSTEDRQTTSEQI